MRYDKLLEEYKAELSALNLHTQQDLKVMMAKMVKPAQKLILIPSDIENESQFESHFGGLPYAEKCEIWPVTNEGKPLELIFQIVDKEGLMLPAEMKVMQFFYNFDEMPAGTSYDGWLVKTYSSFDAANYFELKKPSALQARPYCKISFEPINSVPDWDGIDGVNPLAAKLSCVLNEDEPWEIYKVITKELANYDYCAQIGGYPRWLQGDCTSKNANGEAIDFLFQLDTNEEADLWWWDTGLVYVFYDKQSKKFYLESSSM